VHRIIIQDTVEARILALQEQKRLLVESALDENAGKSISRLGTRELSFLFVSRCGPTSNSDRWNLLIMMAGYLERLRRCCSAP
jgi:hypothetical protein